MDKEKLSEIKALIEEKGQCVLATVSDRIPHCSLMAYAADRDCREIYMVTHKDTTKYKNMMENPAVSLLIDNREEQVGPEQGKALTVNGEFRRIRDQEKAAQAKAALLERHSRLKDFMEAKDAETFEVKVSSFLLLEGLTNSYFGEVEKSFD